MRFIKPIFAINCAALMALAVTAGKTSREPTTEYRKAIFSAPLTLDPVMMDDGASLVVSEMIYEGLLRLTDDYGFEGALAESWTTSIDGRKLTFKIRKNARFSNGQTVEAADVVVSLTRAVAPQSRVFSYFSNIEGAREFQSGDAKALSGLRAIDTSTVEITLEKPFPPFMYVLAGATAKVLPRSLIHNGKISASPIGSGPFQLGETEAKSFGKTLVLNRNPFFNGPRGNIERILLVVASERVAQEMAAAGRIDDLANWPLAGTEPIFEKGREISSPVAGTWIIGLNSRLSPFKSQNVRRAFRDSFDSDEFRKKFYPDAQTAHSYIPAGFPGANASGSHRSSGKLIAAREKITVAIPEGLARGNEIADYIEQRYRNAGWNVVAKVLPWSELMKGYTEKSLQAFLVNMNVDYPDSEFLLRNFTSDNPDNFSGMSVSELDKALSDARSTSDRLLREAKYRRAAELVDRFSPAVYLFHPRSHAWVSKCIRDFDPNLLSDIYIRYAKVRLDPNCVGARDPL